jgi:hypothetical protein
LIAHFTSRASADDVAVFDPVSGKERPIAQGLIPIGFSTDGKWIGLQGADLSTSTTGVVSGDILLAPADGGQPRTVFHGAAIFPFFAPDPSRIIFFSSLGPPQLQSIAINDGLGAPPQPYASQVLLQAFTEFGPQALMDFDFVHQSALVSVNESDMDIVRRKANP